MPTEAGAHGPLVSVLIPAYNAASSLTETLASVCGQTYRNLDIIVVDDGSTDDTVDLVGHFSRDDPRIRMLRQDNAGVAAARNLALRHAAGPLVAPVDADDLWHPTKIERQVRRLREATDAAVVYCWSVDIDAASRVTELRRDQDECEGDVYAALVLANIVGNASVPLIRRDLAMAVGGWDPSLRARNAQGCEDWQFYLRLAARARFALEPAFLVGYRQSASAMSRQLAAMRRSYDLMMREVSDRRPRPPSGLLRWSRAGFRLYQADLLLERGNRLRALGAVCAATLAVPSVVGLASYRKRLRRRIFGGPEYGKRLRSIFASQTSASGDGAARVLTLSADPKIVEGLATRHQQWRRDPIAFFSLKWMMRALGPTHFKPKPRPRPPNVHDVGRPFHEVPVERDFRIGDGAVRDRRRSEAARLKLGPG